MRMNDLERQKINLESMSQTTHRFFNDQYLCFYRDQQKATRNTGDCTCSKVLPTPVGYFLCKKYWNS